MAGVQGLCRFKDFVDSDLLDSEKTYICVMICKHEWSAGQLEAVFEFKVHLWPSQTCFEFIELKLGKHSIYKLTYVV